MTALYEIELRPDARWERPLGTLRLRWRSPETGKVSEVGKDLRIPDLAPFWGAASPSLRLAAVVAQFGELLRGSPWARAGNLGRVSQEAREVSSSFRQNAKVTDFVNLASRAAAIERKRHQEKARPDSGDPQDGKEGF